MMNNKMSSFFSLTNHFLIAMPSMADPFFQRSLIYICDHSDRGAMGVMVNKPSPLRMDLLFDVSKTPTPSRFQGQRVLMGGPVQIDRGFLVHTPVGSWQNSLLITDEIAMTTSRDIIASLSQESEVNNAIATIGYSQWQAGQLEQELANNDWLTVAADKQILFELPYEQRYQSALKLLNIDLAYLAPQVGRA